MRIVKSLTAVKMLDTPNMKARPTNMVDQPRKRRKAMAKMTKSRID